MYITNSPHFDRLPVVFLHYIYIHSTLYYSVARSTSLSLLIRILAIKDLKKCSKIRSRMLIDLSEQRVLSRPMPLKNCSQLTAIANIGEPSHNCIVDATLKIIYYASLTPQCLPHLCTYAPITTLLILCAGDSADIGSVISGSCQKEARGHHKKKNCGLCGLNTRPSDNMMIEVATSV